MVLQVLTLMVSAHFRTLTSNLTRATRFSAPTHHNELPVPLRHNNHRGHQDLVRRRRLFSLLSRPFRSFGPRACGSLWRYRGKRGYHCPPGVQFVHEETPVRDQDCFCFVMRRRVQDHPDPS